MDFTTEREVQKIVKQGWYEKSQMLGEGGWKAVYVHSKFEWKTYVLTGVEGEIGCIVAKDDETAYKAFSSLFQLDMCVEWEIHEKVTEYRLVKSDLTKGE